MFEKIFHSFKYFIPSFKKLFPRHLDQGEEITSKIKEVVSEEIKLPEIKEEVTKFKEKVVANLTNPEIAQTVYSPAIKTATSLGVRVLLHPYSTMMVNMIKYPEKYGNAKQAFQVIKENPFKGVNTVVKGTLLNSGVIFLCSDVLKEFFSPFLARTGAVLISSVISNPFDNYKTLFQIGQVQGPMKQWLKNNSLAAIYRGFHYSVLQRMSHWSIGLGIGDKFESIAKEQYGDNYITNIAAKTLGITTGNILIGTPITNIQYSSVMENRTFTETLKHMKLFPVKGQYSAENYAVTNSFIRFVLGMPLDPSFEPSIQENDKGKIKTYHLLKNGHKLWKGGLHYLPISIFNGITLAIAENMGNKVVEKCKK